MKHRRGRSLTQAGRVRDRRTVYRPRMEGLETRELLSLTTVGSEFSINTTTTSAQQNPAIAADTAGDFVVAWQSGDFTNGYEIRARRYNAAGVAQGNDFVVNSSASDANGYRFNPSVAMDSAGDFVVSWEYYDVNGTNTTGYDIFARRYNAAGTALANEFRVNTTTTGDQGNSSVAMDSTGDFVVAWRNGSGASATVLFQRYNASGVAQGANTSVDAAQTTTQTLPSAAMDSSGNFAIAFAALTGGLGDSDGGVYFNRFNASGVAQGSVTRVNTTITGLQTSPSIAMAPAGSFTVAWSGNGTQAGQSDTSGVFFQRYDSVGAAQGTETRANTTTAGGQIVPKVAISPQASTLGNFTVTWGDDTSEGGGNFGIYAQNFTAAGAASGTQIHVNTTTTGNQNNPAIATGGNGGVTIVWQGPQTSTDIFGQRYSTDIAPVVTQNPSNQTVNPGQTATFTAAATGTPTPGLQWQVSTDNGANFSNIGGATTSPLSFTAQLTDNGKQYRAVFTNAAGTATTTAATLTVSANTAPSVTQNPTNQTVNAGQTATFTAAATGNPTPTVQWQVNTGSGFNNIGGATSTTLNVVTTAADNGNLYRAVFTNTVGSATTTAATLTVLPVAATITQTTVGWGTQTSTALVTQGDGLRLLPAGRTTSFPWLNINKLNITLSSAQALSPSDVSVMGVAGGNYGPVTISGGGTSYMIMFALPISIPDRVTVIIGNVNITNYARRLDVLPGDVNDDGVVNAADMSAVTAQVNTPTALYVFADIDGSGVVNQTDYTEVRRRIGRTLPT